MKMCGCILLKADEKLGNRSVREVVGLGRVITLKQDGVSIRIHNEGGEMKLVFQY